MAFHILCPECGEDLAIVGSAYSYCKTNYIKKTLENQQKKVNIDKIGFKNDIFDVKFILDGLGITKMCCVSHMLGETSFDIDL